MYRWQRRIRLGIISLQCVVPGTRMVWLNSCVFTSVADPDAHRILIRKIHIFWPPGSASGSVSHKYGSGSGSGSRSFHQTKIVRKTLISTVLWLLYDFLSLKNDVNIPVFRIRIRIQIRKVRILLDLPDLHLDPRIRIRTEMSRIRNTDIYR